MIHFRVSNIFDMHRSHSFTFYTQLLQLLGQMECFCEKKLGTRHFCLSIINSISLLFLLLLASYLSLPSLVSKESLFAFQRLMCVLQIFLFFQILTFVKIPYMHIICSSDVHFHFLCSHPLLSPYNYSLKNLNSFYFNPLYPLRTVGTCLGITPFTGTQVVSIVSHKSKCSLTKQAYTKFNEIGNIY